MKYSGIQDLIQVSIHNLTFVWENFPKRKTLNLGQLYLASFFWGGGGCLLFHVGLWTLCKIHTKNCMVLAIITATFPLAPPSRILSNPPTTTFFRSHLSTKTILNPMYSRLFSKIKGNHSNRTPLPPPVPPPPPLYAYKSKAPHWQHIWAAGWPELRERRKVASFRTTLGGEQVFPLRTSDNRGNNKQWGIKIKNKQDHLKWI